MTTIVIISNGVFLRFPLSPKATSKYLDYIKFISSPILPRMRGFFKSSLHKKTRHESDLFVPRGVSFHEQKVLKLVHWTNRYGPSINPTFEHKNSHLDTFIFRVQFLLGQLQQWYPHSSPLLHWLVLLPSHEGGVQFHLDARGCGHFLPFPLPFFQ